MESEQSPEQSPSAMERQVWPETELEKLSWEVARTETAPATGPRRRQPAVSPLQQPTQSLHEPF
ncbi:hypothetical protein PanWU01x14_346960 [Parasponia andersonii]|uniref:Uncharacterized protein n=1 Tax=Parasponia andersonii TaxID=3476 RepID=A0A2P5AC73_PARAD|nr:hypothetical protein PanWU01x14_346960 [Parasponia andersonii]